MVLLHLQKLFPGRFTVVVPPILKDKDGCRVIRATSKSGIDNVVKITSSSDRDARSRAVREIQLLQKFQELKAPHICGRYGSVVTAKCCAVVLEHMNFGTVRDVLKTAPPDYTVSDPAFRGGATRLLLQQLVYLSLDALSGLVAMHAEGVYHSDIKPSNIVSTRVRRGERAFHGSRCSGRLHDSAVLFLTPIL